MLRDGSFWDFGFALPGSVAAPNSQLLRQRHFTVGKDVAASLQPTVAAAAVFDGFGWGTSLCSLPNVNPYAPYRRASRFFKRQPLRVVPEMDISFSPQVDHFVFSVGHAVIGPD